MERSKLLRILKAYFKSFHSDLTHGSISILFYNLPRQRRLLEARDPPSFRGEVNYSNGGAR